MKLSGIKAVGIDIDDTLFMSEAACFELENEVLARLGREPMTREAHLNNWGQPLFEAIKERSPGVNVEAFRTKFAQTFSEFIEYGKLDQLAPKTEKALETLVGRGLYVFLLTSRLKLELNHLLADHPIHNFVAPEDIFHGDNMPYSKPDPRVFDWLRDKGFEPEECVYVGDSVTDGEAANGAGVRFVASLESGLRTREQFAHLKVDAFIIDLSELPDIIG